MALDALAAHPRGYNHVPDGHPRGSKVEACLWVRVNILRLLVVVFDPEPPCLQCNSFLSGGRLPSRQEGGLVIISNPPSIGGAVSEHILAAKVPALPQHAHSDLLGLWDLLKATGGGEGIRTPGTLRFI